MNAIQLARMIAYWLLFLDSLDIDHPRSDDIVQVEELLAYQLGQLDKDFILELIAAFDIVAEDYEDEAKETVKSLAEGLGLVDIVSDT